MTVDLAERISTATRSSYDGFGYRQLATGYDPLSGEGGRIHGGRFNEPDSFPVLDLCSTPGCAAAEFVRFADQQPIGPAGFLPRSLYRYDVRLTSVLDLTDASTLSHLEVSPTALVDDDRTLTRAVGEIAHQLGYQAVLNASATGVDDVLAVLIENLRNGHFDHSLDQTWDTVDDLPIF